MHFIQLPYEFNQLNTHLKWSHIQIETAKSAPKINKTFTNLRLFSILI